MPVTIEIDGKITEFANEAVANEAKANAANNAAGRFVMRAGTGGKDYKAESRALAFTRNVVADSLVGVKAADQTDARIADVFGEQTEIEVTLPDGSKVKVGEGYLDMACDAWKYTQAVQTLQGKHQAPMQGGKLPRDVAAAAITLVRPASPAASRATALAYVTAAVK